MQGFEISESIPASSHIEIVRMAATMCGFMAITYLLGQDCLAKNLLPRFQWRSLHSKEQVAVLRRGFVLPSRA